MSIKTLSYFLKTAEEMNFTRAAEKLYITQQSLSTNIRSLEQKYNTELFIRKPFLKLTPAGELMVAYARQMVNLESRMSSSLADVSANCVGHITMGMSRQRSNVFYPNMWMRYHDLYKNVKVTLYGQVTANMIEDLQNGKLDFFVGIDVPPLKNFIIKDLVTEPMLCIIHEKLLKKHMPDTWSDFLTNANLSGLDLLALKDFPFIMFLPNNRLRITADQIFTHGNITPNVLVETAEHNIIYQLGCSGNGVALLSPISLYDGKGGYRKLPKGCHLFSIRNSLAETNVSLVSRADIAQPMYIQTFQKVLIDEFNLYKNALKLQNIL